MRVATPQGFNSGDQFLAYLRDSFETLYEEGAERPRMLSVGLHCRLVGRPGRAAALARFLDHIRARDKVWVARRLDIARHWIRRHPPAGGYRPSRLSRALFLELFGDVFEPMPAIAGAAYDAGLTAEHDSAEGLHRALVAAMRALPRDALTALIQAHPDRAGSLAPADAEAERAEALRRIERIALQRLRDRLPG
jgi:hypothetical protein